MKIAFCIPDMIIGGVETVFIRTLDGMLKSITSCPAYKDIDVCIITHARITEPLYKDWLQKHGVEVFVCYPMQNWFEGIAKYTNFFPLKQLRKLTFSLYKKLKRRNLKNKFSDIDLFIDYKNCSFFKELKCIDKQKIAWVHGTVGYLHDIGVDKHLDFYDKIVGLTDDFVTDFKNLFPYLSDRVTRIYNPIEKEEVVDLAIKGNSMPGEYFCHVSRLENVQKDLRTLILAFEQFYLHNSCPDVKLVIIGGGPKEREVRKFVSTLKCAENVVFTGVLKNPFGYMKNALANILSSKIEGLPTVLLESMAVETLCVSADCKYGPREILLNGEAGMLFDVGDINQLSNIMTDIYQKRIDTDKFVKRATESLSRFSAQKVNEQIMDLL